MTLTGARARTHTVMVPMRDGTRLATDLWMPARTPAPVVAIRTPYGRANPGLTGAFAAFADHGYVVVAQDCRGTGESEPDEWDYYVFELEDGYDLAKWITQQQWSDGAVFSCGGSYAGQTQWAMALHPRMTAIAPEMSGAGLASNTTRLHMFLAPYSRTVGKGTGKVAATRAALERDILPETLAGGYFNDPLEPPFPAALRERYPAIDDMSRGEAGTYLWRRYASADGRGRREFILRALGVEHVTMAAVEQLSALFGPAVPHDAHSLPFTDRSELFRSLRAPALMITGWYDWALNDALATWDRLVREAPEHVASRSRLLIAPSAHNAPGYREGTDGYPELERPYRTAHIVDLLLRWYGSVREDRLADWPRVTYYLMGANEWRSAAAWPPPEARTVELYLHPGAQLSQASPPASDPDRYTYDPLDPTPTVGGSVVSAVYPPGSVDVRAVHARADVLTYTTDVLAGDLDVVGPLRSVLYASSSAADTDFAARLSDVLTDGRAIQIQSGILRARHRDLAQPALLELGRVYELEIDMWATAHRFARGHRLRLDISSADFPRFDRNSGRGGDPGPPVVAQQMVFHDPDRPSRLIMSVLSGGEGVDGEVDRFMTSATDLHRDAVVVDCHNDLIETCVLPRLGDRATFRHRWIPELRAGGVDVQVIPIFAESSNPESSLRTALQQIAAFYREVEANPDDIAACGTGAEIRAALAKGKIAMVLALEGASCLGNEPSLVRVFYRLGVRMISFAHFGRSWLADGSGENETGGGLTRAGVSVLAEMERLGIVADVSHLGIESTRRILELSTRPVVASHSSARALRDHHRNLTDDQLKAIARTRGVIGVNFFPGYVDAERPSIGRVVDHIEHIVHVVGPDHIGLGPDFIVEIFEDLVPPSSSLILEGVDARQRIDGLYAPRHLPAITDELVRRGCDERTIRGILGGNFLRVFDEVLGRPLGADRSEGRRA